MPSRRLAGGTRLPPGAAELRSAGQRGRGQSGVPVRGTQLARGPALLALQRWHARRARPVR
eukprot:4046060-Heterocapsa_arctica.AAC.1